MKYEKLSHYFGQIVKHLKDGVLVVDTNGKIVIANPAMAKMSGFSEKEMVDVPCTILDCDACELLRSESNELWCVLFERQSVHKKHCLFGSFRIGGKRSQDHGTDASS